LLSNRDADKEKLQTLCQENGVEYLINDGTWMSFAELDKKIPLSVDDQDEFLRKNKYFEVKDSTTMYYVAISAYKSKESISPLNFETENIRIILLNKRKATLLQRMEDDLISNAMKEKKYEIFKK
jgi:gluconate kinase